MENYEFWHGFKKISFDFQDREAILVFPNQADEKKNWTLKTEYWDAFPETEIALLDKGFHCAYLKNKTRFATKEDCDAKAQFVEFLHKEFGLRDMCVPVGMSCGGAHAINFAGFYPGLIAGMFIDAPVLNFMDYPGRVNCEETERVWEDEFVKAYPGITRAKLLSFDNHPMEKIDILKQHNIPVIMLYGTEDQTVLYDMNGKLMEMEYEGSNLLKVFPRNLQGHHPHGLMGNSDVLANEIIRMIK